MNPSSAPRWSMWLWDTTTASTESGSMPSSPMLFSRYLGRCPRPNRKRFPSASIMMDIPIAPMRCVFGRAPSS